MKMRPVTFRAEIKLYNKLLEESNLKNNEVSELIRDILEHHFTSIEDLEYENKYYQNIIDKNTVKIEVLKLKENQDKEQTKKKEELQQQLLEEEEKQKIVHQKTTEIFRLLLATEKKKDRDKILETELKKIPKDEREIIKRKLDSYKKHLE